jgi:hypothetical protein
MLSTCESSSVQDVLQCRASKTLDGHLTTVLQVVGQVYLHD